VLKVNLVGCLRVVMLAAAAAVFASHSSLLRDVVKRVLDVVIVRSDGELAIRSSYASPAG
jgi:hypothetical protein